MRHACVIPIGIGGALPVAGRGFPSFALKRPGGILLFDCGEGTQMRLQETGLRLSQVKVVFVTHLHGDHFYGLPGLLSTSGLQGRSAPLSIVGPVGTGAILDAVPGTRRNDLTFDLEVIELAGASCGDFTYRGDGFVVTAHELDHGVATFGYRYEEEASPGALDADKARRLGVTDHAQFRALKLGESVEGASGRPVHSADVVGPARPGGVFAYVTDTRPCDGGRALSRDADILFHDSTFSDEQADRASETGHSTAREAAEVARAAGARRLLLAHFSARYKTLEHLVEEARDVFPDTEAAVEFGRYSLGGIEAGRSVTPLSGGPE